MITFAACCISHTMLLLGIILCAEEQLHSKLTVRTITILGKSLILSCDKLNPNTLGTMSSHSRYTSYYPSFLAPNFHSVDASLHDLCLRAPTPLPEIMP